MALTAKGRATRTRIIEGAAAHLHSAEPGEMTLDDVRAITATSKGQLFHYFPGGKEELLVAVTDTAGAITAARIDRLAAVDDPARVVTGMIDRWVSEMQATGFNTGCPIAAAALAGPEEPSITSAAARAFELLRGRISASLIGAGHDPQESAQLASFSVSAIEGALLQARAQRSAQPLRDAEAVLVRILG